MHINFVVGKNGSGKSRHLQEIAQFSRRDTLVICNTVHDRYRLRPSVKKFSARNPRNTPSNIIKSAFIELAREGTYRLNAIAKVLEYCNYNPRVTFIGVLHKDAEEKLAELNRIGIGGRIDFDINPNVMESISESIGNGHLVFEINLAQSYMEPRVQEMLLAILEGERYLKKLKLLKSVEVYIQHEHGNGFLRIDQASSGELAMIASQIFILTNVRDGSLILIDEPENSLHPQWQKDYVNKLGDLIGRYDVEVHIATHSPLIVSGIRNSEDRISFHYAETGFSTLGDHPVPSVEESLWEQFETITPESRYVSDHVVDLLEDLDNKKRTFYEVTQALESMERASYDERQGKVLEAAKKLAIEIHQEAQNV
ncbi:AAA family ATPase [Pseudomonas sp. MH9.3]|uniref:AAA family ATPase n=1 Tax=Pseudomonas sp. MH9.3 TaxID=3048630 RepID=UPI002AC9607A|nr:AAA family ATPase [Pseudomonas sp. MH9.3]MEB0105819.1 AAA family ATPase [Pseudomonas sp. MH9.3]WPX80102.1 AAA family ATPase [Pseudomonas sp. MH9.3]WQG57891.1 AAA family ATPase [Pseudomonas sp. RTB3]